MSRHCTICVHAKRAEIELRIASRIPARKIGALFKVSCDAVTRHRRKHMTDMQVIALQAKGRGATVDELQQLKRAESESLLAHLVHERVRQQRIADKAETIDDLTNATRASLAVIKTSDTIARLLGEIKTGTTHQHLNILLQPEYTTFRAALVRALRPFPDARGAVLEAVQAMEAPLLEHQEAAHVEHAEPVTARG